MTEEAGLLLPLIRTPEELPGEEDVEWRNRR